METGTKNGSRSAGSLSVTLDCGRQRSREVLSQQVHVLSLDQIRIVRSTNEYSAGPMLAARVTLQTQRQKTEPAPGPTLQSHQKRFVYGGQQHQHHTRTPQVALTQSESLVHSSSQSNTCITATSTSSKQWTLANSPANWVNRAQPKPSGSKWEELNPLSGVESGEHAYRCKECGKCKCKECACPQTLSCWVCDRRCICSVQNTVDYGTCICCVKGLFYHCSSDDEDVCADNPCSCSQSHCCLRWSAMGVLSLFLPCLWCYVPAKGCLMLSQGCYDRIMRPGCRCIHTNTVHCTNVEKSTLK